MSDEDIHYVSDNFDISDFLYDGVDLETALAGLIKIVRSYDTHGWKDATLDNSAWSGDGIDFSVSYLRPETDSERTRRLQKDERAREREIQKKRQQELRERQEYERLRKKFETRL